MSVGLLTKGKITKQTDREIVYVNINNISVAITKEDPININVSTVC